MSDMYVSAGIFVEHNKILITRRAPDQSLSGFWEFPGGKQEQSETIFECLEREILEELNVNCRPLGIFFESKYEHPQGCIYLIAIKAELLNDNIVLTVHDKYEWVNIEDLLNYNLAPADIPIARRIVNEYFKN